MTDEQKKAHEKRVDEFLAVARRFFIEREAEPVICLGIDRNGEMTQEVVEDTAPAAVVEGVLCSAMQSLHDRIFDQSHQRWVRAIDWDVEIERLKDNIDDLKHKIDEANKAKESTSPSLSQSPPR